MTPSKFQQSILDAVLQTDRNLGINAVAGSGKSTTLKMICETLPLTQSSIICAFNKDIAEALRPKVPQHVHVKTLNGFGHGIVTKAFKCKLDANKTETIFRSFFNQNDRQETTWFYRWKNLAKKIVGICKGQLSWPTNYSDLAMLSEAWRNHIDNLIDTYGWETPKEGLHDLFYQKVADTFQRCINTTAVIDFDDQLFFPIYYNLDTPRYDNFLIDECQDLNRVQIELVCRSGKRVIACGDPCQAIYGFRGADSNAYNVLMEKIDAVRLPLSVCYRCSTSVVLAAKSIVPQIEAAAEAPEGSVTTIKYADFETQSLEGDYVLCRCTAPLVSGCLGAIRSGKRAVVLGRDIADQLVALINKLAQPIDSIETFYKKLKDYESRELQRLSRTENEAAIQQLQDKVDTLTVLCERSANIVKDILSTISVIFSNEAAGITFSTVHKAKGLEADNVFILAPELMPHPMAKKDWQVQQEMNIKYVAITRAKKNLKWVTGNKNQNEAKNVPISK